MDRTGKVKDLRFVFVHGLSGWGSYDKRYKTFPYWGMLGGDLIRYLNRKGFRSYAASVAPEGSAWDRACELYAQITGTLTDYGREHSTRCGHARFGPDFTGRPLIPDLSSDSRIVLLGHSFGGATVRLFSELFANGSREEREYAGTDDISALFIGGNADKIHSVVTLAAPTNGTTAYDLFRDSSFDTASVLVPKADHAERSSSARSRGIRSVSEPETIVYLSLIRTGSGRVQIIRKRPETSCRFSYTEYYESFDSICSITLPNASGNPVLDVICRASSATAIPPRTSMK